MIENKELPDDALMLIKKLEQYFGIRLRKLEVVGEDKKSFGESLVKIEEPARILKFEREAVKNITIGDLVKMKKVGEETKITEEKIEIKLNEKKSKAGIGDMIWQLKKRREEDRREEKFEEEPANFEEEENLD